MADDIKRDIELGISRNEYDDPARPQTAVLTISTGKQSAGIVSRANVYWIGASTRSTMMSLGAAGGDFGKRIILSPKTRATQAAIDRQHAQAFPAEAIESLVAEAKAYYAEGKNQL